nr:uncharacterized protein CI109_003845 [Kwoniella shandongensis]KAA5527873.1 hypothetical protein CI109_003845 [Kwoniella shandongensis]
MRSPFSSPLTRFLSAPTSPNIQNYKLPGRINTLSHLPNEIASLIFENLLHLHPTLVARLSSQHYSLAIPLIYADVTISRANASNVFVGMCADETTELPYPYGGIKFTSRKAKCFAHTRILRFEDIWSAEALVMASREYPNQSTGYLGSEEVKDKLFPSLDGIIFGSSLIEALSLSPSDIDAAEHNRWESKYYKQHYTIGQREWNDNPQYGHHYVINGEFESLISTLTVSKHLCIAKLPTFRPTNIYRYSYSVDTLREMFKIPSTIHLSLHSHDDQILDCTFTALQHAPLRLHIVPPTSNSSGIGASDPAGADDRTKAPDSQFLASWISLIVQEMQEYLFMEHGSSDFRLRLDSRNTGGFTLCVQDVETVKKIWKDSERNRGMSEEELQIWENILAFEELDKSPACPACGTK